MFHCSCARHFPLKVRKGLEPSGLAFRGGRLLSVSDDHDGIIFEVHIEKDAARFEPFVRFRSPGSNLDMEGIACDPASVIYVASESTNRILKIEPSDGTAS